MGIYRDGDPWSEIVRLRTTLETIAGAHLGDCPAARDELAVAKEHIAYLRQLAWDAVKANAGK